MLPLGKMAGELVKQQPFSFLHHELQTEAESQA